MKPKTLLPGVLVMVGALLAGSCSGTNDAGREAMGTSAPVSTAAVEHREPTLPDGFDVQGHRGARGLKPENTLPAFETALDLGVTTIEFDLHFSAEGEIVIWHDPVIDPDKCGLKPDAPSQIPDPDDPGTPQGALAVRSLTVDELGWFNCNRNPDPERFPEQNSEPTSLAEEDFGIVTLDELFDFVASYATAESKTEVQRDVARVVGYNMETKRGFGDPSAIGDGFDGKTAGPFELRILEVVEEHGVRDRVVIQSFDQRSLVAIHGVDRGIRLAMLTASGDADPGGYAAFGATVWSPKASTISERRLLEAFDAGLVVTPWTVNSLKEAERLAAEGVNGVITDRPDLLIGP
ncbi:MAG: glycerophosphodiester phosphodiesterase family protein [Actinomycetota bacterium]|nr:glycerophosphodiester phosphodiesterase family protein [Actinomycetota bacterium]